MKKIVLFLLLTFAWSWTFFAIPMVFDLSEQHFLLSNICLIGAYGPAVSAYILTLKKGIWSKRIWLFLVVAAVLALIFGWVNIVIAWSYVKDSLSHIPTIISMIAVIMIPTFILVRFLVHSQQDNPLWHDLLTKEKRWDRWIIALFLFPVLKAVTYVIDYVFILSETERGTFQLMDMGDLSLLYIPLLTLMTLLFNGPLNEEVGWRGFLTKPMIGRYGLIGAGIITGLIWGLWHLPLHINGFYPIEESILFMMGFRIVHGMIFGLFFTWFYRYANESVLLAIILHTGVNIMMNQGMTITLVILLFDLIIVINEGLKRKKNRMSITTNQLVNDDAS